MGVCGGDNNGVTWFLYTCEGSYYVKVNLTSIPGPAGPLVCRRGVYAFGHRRYRSIYDDDLSMPTGAVGIDVGMRTAFIYRRFTAHRWHNFIYADGTCRHRFDRRHIELFR